MKRKVNSMFEDLINFSAKSLDWCAMESEQASSQVNDILNLLLDDAQRVAAMSKETLDAIESMQEIITQLQPTGDREMANKLAKALVEASNEDSEIRNFISPIMESLQFQDRISQNMGNVISMLRFWLSTRDKIASTAEFSETDLVEFGNQLLGLTTMNDERTIIRKYIDNLDPENETKNDVLFF